MLNAIYAIARPSGTRVDLSVKTVEVRSMHFSPHSSLILLVFFSHEIIFEVFQHV